MTQTEQRKIEKALIEGVNNETVGSDAHKRALSELLAFQKACEETRKNKANEELENKKIESEFDKIGIEQSKLDIELKKQDIEKQKIESQETLAKCQRDLDEEKFRQDKELADRQAEIEERKLQAEKLARRWNFIGSILSVFGGIFGGIASTVIGYKMFDKQATKAYKFEETGTISSFTSKQVMSGLKPPKK